MISIRWVACFLLALMSDVATAESVDDFYRGKQIRFLIRAAPGGNYDLYARTLGRHMSRYIPGEPSVLPVNMPGAGGLTALHYLDKTLPHDGTAMTIVTQTTALDQSLGLDPNLKTDISSLNWLGNISDENFFLVSRRDSQTKMLVDSRQRETIIGGTGTGGVEVTVVYVMNAVLGTRFKPILGYQSGPAMTLAMARGEIESRATTNLRSLFATTPQGAEAFNVLVQFGLRKDPNYPNIPLATEFAETNEKRAALVLLSKVISLSRPVATQQNVPAARVAALRAAFDATMRDPEFIDEAKRQDLDVSPWTGQEVKKIIDEIIQAPEITKVLVRSALQKAP